MTDQTITQDEWRQARDETLADVNALHEWRSRTADLPDAVKDAIDSAEAQMRYFVFAAARRAERFENPMDCPKCHGRTDFLVAGSWGGCPHCGRGRPGSVGGDTLDAIYQIDRNA